MNNIKKKARLSILTLVGLCFALLSTQTYAVEKKVFYHNNLLGSPVAATDENGNLCWREDYRPYGEKIRNEDQGCGLDDNVTGFTGHVHDRDIGLTYMQARYYDPVVGRFMGVDPIGASKENVMLFRSVMTQHHQIAERQSRKPFMGANSAGPVRVLTGGSQVELRLESGQSLYVYVLDNPFNLVDPFGLTGFGFGYSYNEMQAMSVMQNMNVTIDRLHAEYAPEAAETVMKTEAVGFGIAALALSGQEELVGPFAYAAYASALGATGTKIITTGEITTSDIVDVALASVAVEAAPLASLFTKNGNICLAAEIVAGSADVANGLNDLTHSESENASSPANEFSYGP